MCFSPIRIYNPSRSYRSDVPKYLFVPCGHCQDCQRVKHNEWFFRALIEWNYYRQIGGSVYFVTLTYNDNDLPTYSLPDGRTVTGFDKHHIHNFIKYLRILLARSNLEYRDIKYLICSEYSDKNTKRPHYHGLLYFPYHVPCVGFNSLFNRIIERAWQHGFIICSQFGWEIKTAKGIRYATKYVCKDIGYYKDFLRDYLNVSDKSERKERLSAIKDYLPRHWQSVGFGSPFLNVIKSHDISAFLFRDTYRLNIDKSPDFKIPRYYHLKLEKTIVKDLSRLLDKVVTISTPVGCEVKMMRLQRSLNDAIIRLNDFLQLGYFDVEFPSIDAYTPAIKWLNKQHSLSGIYHFLFEDYSSLRAQIVDYIVSELPKFDLHQFACYQLFLRYLPLFEDEIPSDKFSEVNEVINRMVSSPCVPPEIAKLGICKDADFIATPLADCKEERKQAMCCNHPFFASYEALSLAIDRFMLVKGVCRDFLAWKKEDENRKIKAWKPNQIHKFSSKYECFSKKKKRNAN